MASITLDNGAILNLSLSEVRELLGTVNVARPGTVETVEELTVEPQAAPKKQRKNPAPAENSASGKVIQRCAEHQGKRGRVGSCPNCVREDNSEASVDVSPAAEDNSVADEQPKTQNRSNKGKSRGKGKRDFASWLADHEDDPMTDPMEKSIRWMLTSRRMSDSNRTKIEKALNANPRLNCKAASKIITFMHGLPKVAA